MGSLCPSVWGEAGLVPFFFCLSEGTVGIESFLHPHSEDEEWVLPHAQLRGTVCPHPCGTQGYVPPRVGGIGDPSPCPTGVSWQQRGQAAAAPPVPSPCAHL